VADEASNSTPRPFDVQTVKYLVALMRRHDLSEIDLREGDQRIRLLRGPRGKLVTAAPLPASLPSSPVPNTPMAAAEPPRPARALLEIKSEGPGTFYSKPNPDAEAYVRVGARVTPTTVVGLLEAMKLFTEIQAGLSGVIVEILAENQQPVEYGQVLFRIDPTG
jgi:acetyl-CoA carboxylase biotin carboxyl carrier protein